MQQNGENKKKKSLFAPAVICVVAAFIFTVITVGTVKGNPKKAESDNKKPQKTISETKDETKSEAPSQSNTDTTGVTSNRTESFYKNVKYRSPTAKPADVFKHGRLLLLLNNDWELPENFEWDLVYWSNGESVDALSLNYPEFDTVFAVDKSAYGPLKDMFAAAQKDGLPLQMVSPYRSIQMQDRLFSESVNYHKNRGCSDAEAIKKANELRTFTGTSEHNSGLAFDILDYGNWNLVQSFENTPTAKWLLENAENYGFILRYPKDKTDITGIAFEPWHFRYVGIENAKEINRRGMCLEEYIEYLDGGR